MMGFGTTEITIALMFLAGFGLPLGVPPAAENPAMQYVAPPECVIYATWTGMATPDAKSANQTEQLLAEPEVQEFARSIEKTIGALVQKLSEEGNDPKAQQMAKIAPLWAKTITTRSSAAFATRVEVVQNKLDFAGGFIVDAGDQAVALADGLTQLLTAEDNRPTPVTIGQIKFQRFAPQQGGVVEGEVTIGAAGPYVIVGVGKDVVEGMVERIRGKAVPAWLTALQKRLPVERRASMSYINVKALVDSFLPLGGPDGDRIAESLGVKQIIALESVSGLDAEGMISRGFLQIDGQPRGILTLFDGQSITSEQVGFIPKDATVATAFSLNTLRVYSVVTQLVSEYAPNGGMEVAQMEEMFAEQFGARLDKDVLASLGDTWTLWMSPADGWLGATATVEVRDRAKLDVMLRRVAAMLSDTPPEAQSPQIETSMFGEHQIQTLAMRGMPIRPAWTLTRDRLIVSLSPQSVKAALSARPDEIGLFAGPEFKQAFAGEGQTIAISYQDSAKLFEATYSYITLLAPMMMDAMNETNLRQGQPAMELPFDLTAIPSSRSIHRHLRPGIAITRRTKEGVETVSRQTFPTPNIGTSAPIAVALLLPAVQASREAARRMSSSNNLKQIGLAMHNHHDTFRSFPPAYSEDKDGKPLLSWRVHILPFIEEQQLYNEFHLDEPWDSEHNKKLIARMPKVYRSPNSIAGEGKSVYLAIGGPAGIFPRPMKETKGQMGGIGMAQIPDGTSNTIMMVEANDEQAVIWTKPEEFVPNEKDPLKALIGLRAGGFLAGLADGSVRMISDKVSPETLIRLLKRNDGEVIGRDAFDQ